MNIVSIRGASFDDAAISARGEAFDRVCVLLPRFRTSVPVREIIAKRIIEATKNGERDPARLYGQALVPFGIEDMSMLVVSVGWSVGTFVPSPAFCSRRQPTREGTFLEEDIHGYGDI